MNQRTGEFDAIVIKSTTSSDNNTDNIKEIWEAKATLDIVSVQGILSNKYKGVTTFFCHRKKK